MSIFHFKRFDIDDSGCGMKICSDSVLLAAWLLAGRHATHVLDIGAGSGVLSLLAADIIDGAQITGVEIDAAAAAAARANFAASPWAERLSLIESSFEAHTPPTAPDIIISNPPYFSNGAIAPESARATARHQSLLSYTTLTRYAAVHLSPSGMLGFVSPADGHGCSESTIIFDAEMAGLKLHRLCRVATSPRREPSRLLWHFGRTDTQPSITRLDMRRPDGTYTDDYIALVGDYYLKL